MILHIDIETYSSIDLVELGVFRYVDAPDFEIILFAFAFDDQPVEVLDLANGEQLPYAVKNALLSKKYIKYAHNAQFEFTCISKYFNVKLDISQWRCTSVLAAEFGLPASLKGAAHVIKLDEQKDSRGKKLIEYFCKPCKPTKSNGGRTRNLPEDSPEDWEIFKQYCKQDVETERALHRKFGGFELPEREQELWELDQKINARGVRVDLFMVDNALKFNTLAKAELMAEAERLTGLQNPNSVAQLKAWLSEETGEEYKTLKKADVKKLLEGSDGDIKRVLRIRQSLGKSSTAKYEKMAESVCSDGRIKGLLQFYGASRTGRWAGRIVQVQNLPQNHLRNIEEVRQMLLDGDYEFFSMLYDVPQTLSELIRTAFVPSEGRRFIVSDFSAIEARVIAWLAGEKWRMDVFSDNGDIYCASASQMFGVPVEKHGINGHLRQKGKIAELALGYGGSVGALTSMGALDMGLTEDELPGIVAMWRKSNQKITALWKHIESAAMAAIEGKTTEIDKGIRFFTTHRILFVKLPSGRCIAYPGAAIGVNEKFGSRCIFYMGQNQQTKKWERIESFGGKLTENIVQAIARDCLAESMIRLEKAGYEINFTVHDEVIIDAPKGFGSAEEVTQIMGVPIGWADGLYLKADGYECDFYMKD